MSTASVEFTVTKQDLAEQIRVFRLSKYKHRETIINAIFPYALYAALAATSTTISEPAIALLIVSFLSLLPAYNHFLTPRNTAARRARSENAQAKVLIEVGDDGVKIKDEYIETLLDWRCFQKAIKAEGFLLLVSDERRGIYHFIPPRAFSSEEQERGFLAVLEDKLPPVEIRAFGPEQSIINIAMAISGIVSSVAFLLSILWLGIRFVQYMGT
jgi:hypothetical protein